MGLKNFFKRKGTPKINQETFQVLQDEVKLLSDSLKGINTTLADFANSFSKQDRKLASIDDLSIERDKKLESKLMTTINGLASAIEVLKKPEIPTPLPSEAKPASKKPNTRKH